ncbi:hypothetical protein DSM3645_03678 [Blastopirellula marina DSM 3645]|uniref:Uncharacterized protein n=1 Tax=Blastopirellula marina DSM 3645 TaxID=314230 RepID=A3ZW47_9BACT|nr:hypothetical protein DSM3645_03678 [Blastopirellula marina DSM 3645]
MPKGKNRYERVNLRFPQARPLASRDSTLKE